MIQALPNIPFGFPSAHAKLDQSSPLASQTDVKATTAPSQGLGSHDYNRLLRSQYRSLVGLSWRLLANQQEAEDVTQEVWLRLWRDRHEIDKDRAVPWLRMVCRHLCLDRLRARQRWAFTGIEGGSEADDSDDQSSGLTILVDDRPLADEVLAEQQQRDRLVKFMETLPDRQRVALTLSHWEGLSGQEIASHLDCSLEAVESLLARARRNLRKLMLNEDQ